MPGEIKDNFAAAFEQLAALGDKEPPAPVATTETPAAEPPAPVATTETPAAEPLAPVATTETPAAEPPALVATTETPAAEPPVTAEPPTPPQITDDDLLARFAAIVKKTDPAPAPTPQPAEPVDLFTADEKTFLADYEKDWPDVARAEALRRRAEYQQLTQYIFQQMANELTPVLTMVRTLADRTHLTDLHTEVADYDDVRGKVIEWVDKQPTYLQAAYKTVVAQGTVEEVKDLIDRYRRDTGATLAPAPATPVAAKPPAGLTAAAKQAAAALAPVSSKRSTVTQQTDPNDYDGAFTAFAQKD